MPNAIKDKILLNFLLNCDLFLTQKKEEISKKKKGKRSKAYWDYAKTLFKDFSNILSFSWKIKNKICQIVKKKNNFYHSTQLCLHEIRRKDLHMYD